MYKIIRVPMADVNRGKQLARAGNRDEALDYIREATDVIKEFDTLLEARQFWRALGMPAGANYHETDGMIYRLDVARTD